MLLSLQIFTGLMVAYSFVAVLACLLAGNKMTSTTTLKVLAPPVVFFSCVALALLSH